MFKFLNKNLGLKLFLGQNFNCRERRKQSSQKLVCKFPSLVKLEPKHNRDHALLEVSPRIINFDPGSLKIVSKIFSIFVRIIKEIFSL